MNRGILMYCVTKDYIVKYLVTGLYMCTNITYRLHREYDV